MKHHMVITDTPPEDDAGYSGWAYDTLAQVDDLLIFLDNLLDEPGREEPLIIFHHLDTLYKFKLQEIQKPRHNTGGIR